MTSLPFQFPVLTFSPHPGRAGVRGREFLDYFVDPDDFSTCEAWKRDFRDGMKIADSSGHCWNVVDVRVLGRIGPLWMRVVRVLLRCSLYRVSCGLSEAPHHSNRPLHPNRPHRTPATIRAMTVIGPTTPGRATTLPTLHHLDPGACSVWRRRPITTFGTLGAPIATARCRAFCHPTGGRRSSLRTPYPAGAVTAETADLSLKRSIPSVRRRSAMIGEFAHSSRPSRRKPCAWNLPSDAASTATAIMARSALLPCLRLAGSRAVAGPEWLIGMLRD